VTRARVLSFHVDSDRVLELTEALDRVSLRFNENPDFRGLLCLNHDTGRNQIMVITLWDGSGLEETQAESDYGRNQIAATSDLGVNSTSYDVLRFVQGSVPLEDDVLIKGLASLTADPRT
jgi:hypothetical protein